MVAIGSPQPFAGFRTLAAAQRRLLEEARRAAVADVGVLISGETGTGKGRLARAIHDASSRRAAPFVAVDCSALPPGLLQAELFGHRRGSFSGAERDRVGRLEAAQGGSVFLDRVDELEAEAQTHLLRVIEEREVTPLGDSRPRKIDFRLLASAGPDLRRRVEEGAFRGDLFYRIKVVELELPPLRERGEDIPHLAETFLGDCSHRFGKPLRGFTPAAMRTLLAHGWPGNVRELSLAVEAAAAAARGEEIEASDLPVHVRIPRRPAPAGDPGTPPHASGPLCEATVSTFAERVEEFQRTLLTEALGRSGWSHLQAARELGLERHQLKYLCAKLGIRRSSALPPPREA